MAGTITIGFTKSNLERGYSSFDGYRPEADQDEYSFPTQAGVYDIEQLAEAIFVASNCPTVCEGLARTFQLLLADLPVRSLSVGDTVRLELDGEPAQMVACDRLGWRRIL